MNHKLIRSHIWLQITSILLGIVGFVAYAASKFTPGRLIVIVTGIGLLGFLATLVILCFRLKRFWQIVCRISASLLAVMIGAYAVLFMIIYFFQDAIANHTSSFFQPKTISAETAQSLAAPDVLDIDLTTQDGIHLRGWLVKNSPQAKLPLLIYFGGSGSEVSEMIPLVKPLDGWAIALINYRAFGLSEGAPSHANALSDAQVIYYSFAARPDIDAAHIVVMGYSLGTGVAVQLAAQRPVIGTILAAPYDRWSLVGVQRPPLYAPFAGILKPYFDSIALAPQIKTPLLSLIGADDPVIAPSLSLQLAAAWGGETDVITFPGEDHGLLFHPNASWEIISNFLDQVK